MRKTWNPYKELLLDRCGWSESRREMKRFNVPNRFAMAIIFALSVRLNKPVVEGIGAGLPWHMSLDLKMRVHWGNTHDTVVLGVRDPKFLRAA